MRRGGIIVALAFVLVATACGTSNPLNGPIPETGGSNPAALPTLSVKQNEVPAGFDVSLWPNGDRVEGEVTLNMCDANYPSEALRVARRQVAVTDSQQRLVLSTEAVAYRTPAATVQAFQELRDAQKNCPQGFVPQASGESIRTIFGPQPDKDWPQVPNVERLVFDYILMNDKGDVGRAALTFLRRGRILLGVYVYLLSDQAPPAVDGNQTVDAIVNDFAVRLGNLPESVTH